MVLLFTERICFQRIEDIASGNCKAAQKLQQAGDASMGTSQKFHLEIRALSATLPKDPEEEHEELNDVQVQADGSKGIVIDAELIGTVMLPSNNELCVIHNVEREQQCSTTCISKIQRLHRLIRKEVAANPHEKAKCHQTEHPNEKIRAATSEVILGLAGKDREGKDNDCEDAERQGHRLCGILNADQANQDGLSQSEEKHYDVVLWGLTHETWGTAEDTHGANAEHE